MKGFIRFVKERVVYWVLSDSRWMAWVTAAALFVTILLTTGCAEMYVWERPGSPPSQAQYDQRACAYEGLKAGGPLGHQVDVELACMQLKGYHRVWR